MRTLTAVSTLAWYLVHQSKLSTSLSSSSPSPLSDFLRFFFGSGDRRSAFSVGPWQHRRRLASNFEKIFSFKEYRFFCQIWRSSWDEILTQPIDDKSKLWLVSTHVHVILHELIYPLPYHWARRCALCGMVKMIICERNTPSLRELIKVDFKSKVGCISAKSLQVVLVPSRRLQVALVSSGVRLANQGLVVIPVSGLKRRQQHQIWCHQRRERYSKIRFRLELCPGRRWESSQRSPSPLDPDGRVHSVPQTL